MRLSAFLVVLGTAAVARGQALGAVEERGLAAVGSRAREVLGSGDASGASLWGAAAVWRVASARGVAKGAVGAVQGLGGADTWGVAARGLVTKSKTAERAALGADAVLGDWSTAAAVLSGAVAVPRGVVEQAEATLASDSNFAPLAEAVGALAVLSASSSAANEGSSAARACEQALPRALERAVEAGDVVALGFVAMAANALKAASGAPLGLTEDHTGAAARALSSAWGAVQQEAMDGGSFFRAGAVLGGLAALDEGVARPLAVWAAACGEKKLRIGVASLFGQAIQGVRVSARIGSDSIDLSPEKGGVVFAGPMDRVVSAAARVDVESPAGVASYHGLSVGVAVCGKAAISAATLVALSPEGNERRASKGSTLQVAAGESLTALVEASVPASSRVWLRLTPTSTTSSSTSTSTTSSSPACSFALRATGESSFSGSVELSALPESCVGGGSLEAVVEVAGATTRKAVRERVAVLSDVPLPPPPAPPAPPPLYAKPLLDESDNALHRLPEIHHQHRTPEKQVPLVVALAVAGALIAILLVAATSGVALTRGHGRTDVPPFSAALFLLTFAATLACDALYFFELPAPNPLLPTAFHAIAAKAVLGTVAVFTGHALLKSLKDKPFAK